MSAQSLQDAIAANYAVPQSIVWDGALHRFATDPDKRHSKDGWYVAHDDAKGKAAAFGSWRDGTSHTWSNGTGRQLTAAELRDIEAKKKQELANEKKRREQAALRAQRVYADAEADPMQSAYLARKGIDCPAGARAVQGLSSKALGFDGTEFSFSGLLIPLRNRDGELRSLQLIPDDPQRQKLFMKGGQSAGCFYAIGEIAAATVILIGEGVATCQSAHQAIGHPAVVAFSAGNLPDIAETIRAMNATAQIVILADDDLAGRTRAALAAQRAQGRVALPGSGVNDFNDLHRDHGLDAVRAAILGTAAAADAAPEDGEHWRAELIVKHKNDGTQIIPCRVHNLILILRYAPEFKGRIRYNRFSGITEVDNNDLNDSVFACIKAQVEKSWIQSEKVGSADLLEAINGIAIYCGYHPVQEYLNALTWDGIERIENLFSNFLDTPKDPYHMGAARAFFAASVARIYQPGFKVDLMPILEGPQGVGKSSFWETLGGEWYADITDDINDKDFQAALQGVWIADLGELEQFGRADSSRIKQLITIKKDRLRRPYAKFHENLFRQTVLVGGSNRSDWINDPTGGRRFLPISCRTDKIDLDALRAARDQLWAEAVYRYRAGDAGWWDVPDANEHQQARFNEDPWQQPIEKYLANPGLAQVTANQILAECIRIDIGKQTQSDWTRVGKVMVRIEDWEKTRRWNNDIKKQVWVYVRRQSVTR
jgi:putative DNA primase/helicase